MKTLISRGLTKARKGLLVLAVMALCSTAAYANGGSKGGSSGGGGGGVPELDPRSLLAALTLLSGGVMMLTDKYRPQ